MLLLGTNFFSDPKGNTINIDFEEGLLGQRQFRGVQSIRSFYNVNDVYYVCTVYCGDRFFRIRLFDLDWNEFDYPGTARTSLGCNPLSSIRFFQAFRVQFIPATMLITVPDYFQIFCRDKLAFNYAVKLYDPLSKMFEIYVDTDESLRMVLFGFNRILSAEGVEMDYNRDSGSAANTQVPVVAPDFEKVLSNYDVKASSLYLDSKFAKECWIKGRKSYRLTNDQSQFWDCKIRWTGRSSYECYLTCGWKKFYVFLHRIFSAEGVEMDYNRNSGSAANTQVPVAAPNFEKQLSNYDVKASSLGRKSYRLTNDQAQFWDCKIRWTARSSYECYLTCGWKKFCKENGLAAGDRIRFVVEDEEKGVIHILKN
ncbi:hypothetical protein DEO72_LG6g1533 [Vigna unguiculata]|uniref:TF-B3 domain-containing protein n=1 Tax=Vigna unguiculata TaxID=3917 RepID=A0A4D6M7K9_VIGUN|nr:hypothetical protein DEO72_LG6g1533 [Vigna unguiculata]